ncbi:uncharacterized protein CBL_02405 [Carabus blaptoides fortunei]
MSVDNLLRATLEEKYAVEKSYGRTEDEITEHIQVLLEWAKKQPHLPQEIDEKLIKRILRWNKFSLEKTKNKIDMYFSIKNIVPEFFDERDMTSSKYQRHIKSVLLLPLPKLTKEFSRVLLFSYLNNNPDNFDFTLHVKYIFITLDVQYFNDDCLTNILILDMGNATISHCLKNNPVVLNKIRAVIQKAYSDRVAAVHFINLPSYAETMVTLTKSLMKAKMADRVHVHKNYESLHKMVPKEILPAEYGGREKSVNELYADWTKCLQDNNDWILKYGALRSNEKLRQGEPIDADIFGSIHGSFRQLTVD